MYSWQDRWEDYYAILKINRTATQEEIEKAWRKRVRGSHPDGVADELKSAATELIKRINRAHDVLSGPTEKFDYDREYDRRNGTPAPETSSSSPGSSNESAGASGRASGSSSGSTDSKKGGRKPPPPPPPPKIYRPIVEVEQANFSFSVLEKETVKFSFRVNHVSGELPPKWKLVISSAGENLPEASYRWYPNRFPLTVEVEMTPQEIREYKGSLEISVVEVK